MESIHAYRKTLSRLFRDQYFGVLSCQGERAPHSCLVAFKAAEDLRTLYVCTGRSTRKYANISASQAVSLLIDNRSNDANDLGKATVVTATGFARELDGATAQAALELYLQKLPDLADFAHAPSTAIVGITVTSYDIVTRFQQVITLNMEPR